MLLLLPPSVGPLCPFHIRVLPPDGKCYRLKVVWGEGVGVWNSLYIRGITLYSLLGNITGLCPITEASFSSGADLVLLRKAIVRPGGSLGDVEQPTEKASALATGDNQGEGGRGLSVCLTGDEREGMGNNNRGEDWPWDCRSVLMVIGCGI